MKALLAAFLILQGVLVRPNESGTVSGIVRTADGRPAIGLRVTAYTRPDSPQDAADGASLAAIAQSDDTGRYRLENVPPGQYYISAGRVDMPTFYPGVVEMSRGTPVQITPGLAVSGIDFSVADASFTVAGSSGPRANVAIPVRVAVDGGAAAPVFAPGGFVLLALCDAAGFPLISIPLNAGLISLPIPLMPQDYDVRVINAPGHYSVKSLRFGGTNLLSNRLRVSFTDAATTPGLSVRVASIALGADNVRIVPGGVASTGIDVALSVAPLVRGAGARVSGQLPDARPRSVTLSGTAGTLYADGTFEFDGVAPGRHTFQATGEPPAVTYGASIVVGASDIAGLAAEVIPLAPREPAPPVAAAAGIREGVTLPLATLRGRLVSQATGEGLRGTVSIHGLGQQLAMGVSADGRFEIPKLLPGMYSLQATIFDYFTVSDIVIVGDADAEIELRARRVF